MSHGHFLQAFKEFGVAGTFKKLYKMRTLKFGKLVGRDKYGNEYFENTKDYPLNQTRWVEYSGDKTFYEVDASNVPAEWHGWLHGSTNEVPTSRTTGSTHKFEPEANAHGSSAPYKRNLGGVINSHTPNLSLYRPRGYGLGNGLSGGSEPFEELYYTQPGWPLDARNKQTRQKRVLPFSLRDTPLSIKQKEAGRSGLALEDYSKSRALLTAAGAPEAATASQEAASQPKGTFAAAVHETLTAEEESFLAEGHDETDIMTTIGHYQRIIDEYQAVPNKSAAAGVAVAQETLEAEMAKLKKLRSITAKLEKLAKEFDERSVKQSQMA